MRDKLNEMGCWPIQAASPSGSGALWRNKAVNYKGLGLESLQIEKMN